MSPQKHLLSLSFKYKGPLLAWLCVLKIHKTTNQRERVMVVSLWFVCLTEGSRRLSGLSCVVAEFSVVVSDGVGTVSAWTQTDREKHGECETLWRPTAGPPAWDPTAQRDNRTTQSGLCPSHTTSQESPVPSGCCDLFRGDISTIYCDDCVDMVLTGAAWDADTTAVWASGENTWAERSWDEYTIRDHQQRQNHHKTPAALPSQTRSAAGDTHVHSVLLQWRHVEVFVCFIARSIQICWSARLTPLKHRRETHYWTRWRVALETETER